MEVLDLKALAEEAVRIHQQGDLAGAEKIYLQILNADPGLFGPRYYLGLMRLQQGRNAEAATYLGEALQISPDNLGALMNYGMALQGAGRSPEALEAFDKALTIESNLPEAHYNRGVALANMHRFEMAVEAYDRALVMRPEMISALINRGVAQSAMGQLDDALVSYDRVLTMQPGNVMALNNRGLALRAMRRLPESIAAYERALSLQPDYIDARYNMAVALLDSQRAAEALVAFESVMGAQPDNAELFNNRGVALWLLKRPAEALASFERTLAIEAHFAEAWGNRGLALRDLARYDEALASFDMLLTLTPRDPAAWNNRGNVLRDMRRLDDAIDSYGKALAIRPDYVDAVSNRGNLWWTEKREYEPAIADLRRVLLLDPEHPYSQGELLHLNMFGADWTDFTAQKSALDDAIRFGQRVARPFMYQALAESPADMQACSRIWARDMYPENPGVPHDRAARKNHKKIRIGYSSGEFREQAVQILVAGLYDAHDKDKFELVALDNGASDGTAMRERLEKAFDKWIDISGLSDEDAAARIRAEEIDILVNLNGYFGKTRMGVFARRPAPVQVNYLGFPATLGAPYMDYIVADKVVIPDDEQRFYDEKVAILPGCYLANDDKGRTLGKIPSRAEAGLPDKGFVFCNFNNAYKLTPDTFAGWMRILKQVDGSVLWLLDSQAPFADNIRKEAQSHGVAGERIIFAPNKPPQEHLARTALADLSLDSLPYNAHTTAGDALWAGVPILTRRGSTFVGRVAASLLLNAGLPELVTESQADYEARAIMLASDAEALKALRGKVVAKRDKGELFDTARFTRHMEDAYQQMWQRWLAGDAPQAFAVKD
jgi:predicted O-linked N-acetylglucosamine transferase (SPINDLY family)